jgi:hypothetical protein
MRQSSILVFPENRTCVPGAKAWFSQEQSLEAQIYNLLKNPQALEMGREGAA